MSQSVKEINTEPNIEELKTSHKGNIYRQWNSNNVPAPLTKHKKSTDKELMEVIINSFNTYFFKSSNICLFCLRCCFVWESLLCHQNYQKINVFVYFVINLEMVFQMDPLGMYTILLF